VEAFALACGQTHAHPTAVVDVFLAATAHFVRTPGQTSDLDDFGGDDIALCGNGSSSNAFAFAQCYACADAFSFRHQEVENLYHERKGIKNHVKAFSICHFHAQCMSLCLMRAVDACCWEESKFICGRKSWKQEKKTKEVPPVKKKRKTDKKRTKHL